MTQLKTLLNDNKFQSFIVALIIWFADFIKSNANLTWEGLGVGVVGFIGTYVSTHQSVKQAVATTTANLIPFTYPAPTESGSVVVAPEVKLNEPTNQSPANS